MCEQKESVEIQSNKPASWVNCIWEALQAFREDCIPECDPTHDEQWDDICTAMAWISEELGVEEPEDDV